MVAATALNEISHKLVIIFMVINISYTYDRTIIISPYSLLVVTKLYAL